MTRKRQEISAVPLFSRLKKKLNLKPAEFAKKINESDQAVSNWRHRGIPQAKVYKVAMALGMSYEEYMREAGQPVPVLDQERAQYTIERQALLDDYDHLPPWLQEHIARMARELRAYADALPQFVREGMASPPTDAEAYRQWVRNIEADYQLRLGKTGKGESPP
jgi:transcriptional regulator with XRE-family HTH domain